VEAGLQPFGQTGFGLPQVDSGHPDLGESQLMRPFPQPMHELLPVEVNLHSHAPILGSRTLTWAREADCAAFAQALAALPALRDAHIELQGPLGAGKTTFVRHLLRALGVDGRIKSPTYTVMEPYEVKGLAISHFDFYRFADPREWADAGLRDVFAAPGLKLSEWPDKAAGFLPRPDLRLSIEPQEADDARCVTLTAFSPRGEQLLASHWPA
jgi:tRNA threonylcarbamoyladenosine biosynthesis protein TsaE